MSTDNQHFTTLLASTIHDIKNSLGIVLQHIRSLSSRYQQDPNLLQLEFETYRINNSLMQLLVLYKVDHNKFSLNIDEYPVSDILAEVRAENMPLLQGRQMSLSIHCPPEQMLFCDNALVCGALGTLLNNAQRYSKHSIFLSAYDEDGFTCLAIEDDGDGYPENMLQANHNDLDNIDWVTGNTGLGLHFVSTIAALHKNNGRQGFIKLDNDSRLGGARFRLFLP
jgi:K+-sensing histidine kinase KdpD